MTSFDISPKFILFRGHKWGHVIIHLDPQFYPLMHPKQSKFGWYIKSCYLTSFLTSHVTYSLNITFIPCFIGRLAHFCPFSPLFSSHIGALWSPEVISVVFWNFRYSPLGSFTVSSVIHSFVLCHSLWSFVELWVSLRTSVVINREPVSLNVESSVQRWTFGGT